MTYKTEQDIDREDMQQEYIEELSNRKIIKISNDLASAQFNIKEVSLNVFIALLSEITMEDEELKEFDISLLEIEKKLGRRLNRDTKNIEELCSDLLGKNILLSGDTDFISLCSKCELIKEDGVLFLNIKINSLLKKELLQLRREFTQINFSQFMQLKGLYPKKMYMLLKKASGLKQWTIPLEDLCIILSAPNDYMEKFNGFKNRVLEPALKQINQLENKEITVSYTVKKRRKKVSSIEFKIVKKAKEVATKNHQSPKSKSILMLEEWMKENNVDAATIYKN